MAVILLGLTVVLFDSGKLLAGERTYTTLSGKASRERMPMRKRA